MSSGGAAVVTESGSRERKSAKGRRRRAAADQRRLEQQRWGKYLEEEEEEYTIVAPIPPGSRRRARRRNDRGNLHFRYEDEDELDPDLALSLALALSLSSSTGDNSETLANLHSATLDPDMTYESLVQLENVTCVASAAVVASLPMCSADGKVSEVCVICQGEYAHGDSLLKLPCSHDFHQGCGSEWLRKYSKLCPVCKHDVTKGVDEVVV